MHRAARLPARGSTRELLQAARVHDGRLLLPDAMSDTPTALWLFNQTYAQAIADPDEPKPGDAAWNPAKWHRVWIDCVALERTIREGSELGTQARAIATGNWGDQT